MSEFVHKELEDLCRRRITRFIRNTQHGAAVLPLNSAVNEILPIVSENLAKRFKRHQKYMPGNRQLTLSQYLDRVINYWFSQNQRVRALHERDETEWWTLFRDLELFAANKLFALGRTDQMAAADYANQTCEIILQSRYPFDVPFDAWARTILLHLIVQDKRSSDGLDRQIISLDDTGVDSEQADSDIHYSLADSRSAELFQKVEDRDQIISILKRLRSPTQQQVILMYYFDGASDGEIARQLGTKVSNVHLLRHRALQRMYQNLMRSTE